MEITQNNAQIIVVVCPHAVNHVIKKRIQCHVLLVSNIQFIYGALGFVENGIEWTVLPFDRKAAIQNGSGLAPAETVKSLALFIQGKGGMTILITGKTSYYPVRNGFGAHQKYVYLFH